MIRDLQFTAAGIRYVAIVHPTARAGSLAWRCVAVHTLPSRLFIGCGVWSANVFESFDRLPAAVTAVLPRVLRGTETT